MAADEPDVSEAEWKAWRKAVFGDPYMVWHDGADLRCLRAPVERDLPKVDRQLVAGLRAHDPLAAQSIEFLAREGRLPERAAALLPDMAAVAAGEFLIRVAETLYVLTGNDSWADPIAAELASASFWGVRQQAASALVLFAPTGRLVRALGQAVRDKEYLVRYHAANTLLQYAGRNITIENVPEIWPMITSPARGRASWLDRARWRKAAALLTAAVPLDGAP